MHKSTNGSLFYELVLSSLSSCRPNKDQNKEENTQNEVCYVKDGKNPDKRFMQLHYLKVILSR